MKFSEKKVFAYDKGRKNQFSFSELVAAYENPERPPPQFSLSGMDDLYNSLLILEEYYTANFPFLDVKEVDRSETKRDPLYNELARQRREYTRVLQIPLFINQDDKATKLTKQGIQTTQEVQFCTSMINLFRVDYFPEAGDEVIWLGTQYQIGEVLFMRNHLHQNTGFPLHVTLKATIANWGDERRPVSLASQSTIVDASPGEVYTPPAIGHRIPVITFDR